MISMCLGKAERSGIVREYPGMVLDMFYFQHAVSLFAYVYLLALFSFSLFYQIYTYTYFYIRPVALSS